MDLKTKRAIRKMFKRGGWMSPNRAARRIAAVHDAINERAYWHTAFHYYAENGHVVLCRSGMDCDCVQYASERLIPVPASIFAWCREEDAHREYLDGPESKWLERPEEDHRDGYRSADRTLEAYEDGHPHSVSWGLL